MDDRPPKGAELFVGVAVAGLVLRDLPQPPLGVPARHRSVFRATVPEASVHLDGYLLAWEGNVDLAARKSLNLVLHSIPQSHPPQSPP